MRASTELFLFEMMSLAEELFRPSFRYAGESFEGWAYRNGLLRQLQRLEAEAYLERQPGGRGDRLYRLTPKGRLAALGGRDPDERWNRSWDGRWRLLMFDLPESPQAPRVRLRKVLREYGLGCLQGSVWLSPDPLEAIRKQLRGDRHPSSLLLFEGRTIGGEKPRELVREAWNFEAVQQEWAIFRNFLEQGKTFLNAAKINPDEFRAWSANKHRAWKQVLEVDPLLPAKLLPSRYPGRKIWKRHLSLSRRLTHRIRETGFKQ